MDLRCRGISVSKVRPSGRFMRKKESAFSLSFGLFFPRTDMKRRIFALTAVAVACAQGAYAGGFMLMEQTAAGLGRANAGAGVFGDDASAAWFNPAGMTLLKGSRFQVGSALGLVDGKYVSKRGGGSDNARDGIVPIPFLHTTYQLTDNLWVGFSIDVPFGMQTKYKDSFDGRDRGISAKVKTFDFNPSIAYKVNDAISVGVGVSAQYGSVELGNGYPGTSLSTKVKGSDVAWGANAGVMIVPTENTRFGLAWRSAVKHDLDGHFKSSLGTQDSTVKFKTPQTIILSGAWDINEKWTVAGTFRWSDWSTFVDLPIYKRSGDYIGGTDENWKDCYLFSLGADYRYSDEWTYRAGIAYETSTIREAKYRMTTVPDSARLWLSLGASWKPTKEWQFDAGYLFMHGIGHSRITASSSSDETIGTYKRMNVHMLAVQAVYSF